MKRLFLSFFGILFSCLCMANTTIHVSQTEKIKGEKSFNSIHEAIEYSRKIKDQDIIIMIHQGCYYLEKPIVITSEDSNDYKSLTIQSFDYQDVVISGAKLLENLEWREYRDGIYMTQLKSGLEMDMLIVDGQIRDLARYPNYDANALRFKGMAADAIAPERVKSWSNPKGGYFNVMHRSDWGGFHFRILGSNNDGELEMEGGWQNNQLAQGIHPENRMVENIFEELDFPREWYYDDQEETLYYYPAPNEDLSKIKIESAQLKNLITVQGSVETPVKNLTIKGLKFTHSLRTFMENSYEKLLRSDWSIYRGGAIFVEGSEGFTIKDCDIYNLGGNAIFFSNYNRNAEVSASHIMNIGASAICFVGDINSVRSPSCEYRYSVPYDQMDKEKGPKGVNFPANCLVDDNLIHDIGIFEKQVAGVQISMSQSITISHNSIYNLPRAGINVSEGTWGGHQIAYNDVFNTVMETGDHGAFNSWGRDRLWIVDRNYMDEYNAENPSMILYDATKPTTIHNNRMRCDRGWDIDLDDGSSNYHIFNNLCLNGGIKLREGYYRTVENNIIVNNTYHPHISFTRSGDVFTRNIVMSSYKPIQIRSWGLMTDYNIFTDSIAYRDAMIYGTDQHSIVVPLAFANPAEGDFTVADDSDAITQGGFRNIPMEFGVTSPRLVALAQKPEMPTPTFQVEQPKDITQKWMGAEIKSLTTAAERSATTMDSERGVYVISVDGNSAVKGLMANDVIIKVTGKECYNLADFMAAIKHPDVTINGLKLTIYRVGEFIELKM